LGLGETRSEVLACMDELHGAGVDILVMGQYLQPSKLQIPVASYITPAEFENYRDEALARGFASVISAPLARTSYHARQTYGESTPSQADLRNESTLQADGVAAECS
jgi:lipoic acid synthetase